MYSHQSSYNNRYSFVFEDYFSLVIETFFVVFCYGLATYKGSARWWNLNFFNIFITLLKHFGASVWVKALSDEPKAAISSWRSLLKASLYMGPVGSAQLTRKALARPCVDLKAGRSTGIEYTNFDNLKIHTQLSGFGESNQEEKSVINLSIIHPWTSKLFLLIYYPKPQGMNSNYCKYSVISVEIGLLFW